MRCFKHGGGVPCDKCNMEEYDRCIQENTQGKDPPHDLTELRKILKIPFEKASNTIKTSELPAPDLAENIRIKDKLRFGR